MKKNDTTPTYLISVHCSNCHARGSQEIPMGTTVEDWLRTVSCNRCGCYELCESKETDIVVKDLPRL